MIVNAGVLTTGCPVLKYRRNRDMKLTKEDYMRLPKERLAELLVEMDSHPIQDMREIPVMPTPKTKWGCDGTICTNPQMDCINCPRILHYNEISTSDSSGIEPLTAKQKEK